MFISKQHWYKDVSIGRKTGEDARGCSATRDAAGVPNWGFRFGSMGGELQDDRAGVEEARLSRLCWDALFS